MAITPAQDLKAGDIIRTHSRGDALAVIYKVVRAVGGDKTVEQLEVFPLVTADNAPNRSRQNTGGKIAGTRSRRCRASSAPPLENQC